MPKGTHAYGTKLSWGGALVGGLNKINGVEIAVDSTEVTTHDSVDSFKEFIPTLINAGDVPIEGFFDPTDINGQLAMMADTFTKAIKACVITFPASTGAAWNFNAFITRINIGDAPVDGAIPFSATLQITGKPTLTVAASAGMSAVAISNSAVITPTFAIGTFDYVATVLTGVTSVTVTPTAASGVITVNGSVVASGQASSAIPLGAAGSVTLITVVVTETNKAPKTYTFRIARA